MGRRSKVSPEQKLLAIQRYADGVASMEEISRELGVDHQSIRNWRRLYETFGKEGLQNSTVTGTYSKDFKIKAVEEYLEGVKSQADICKIFRIRSPRTLQCWIEEYNRGELVSESFNAESPLKEVSVRKKDVPSRSYKMSTKMPVSYELKLEAVTTCIASGYNYQEIADEFGVTYSQVYNWVKKYEAKGEYSLLDKRGRPKSSKNLNETDILKAEIRVLKAENRRKDAEIEALKKAWHARRGRWD